MSRIKLSCAALAAVCVVGGCEQRPPQGPANPVDAKTVALASDSGGAAPFSFAPIVSKVAPAVVSIDAAAPVAQPRLPFGFPTGGPQPFRVASGSGFLISPDGFIATNNHVIAGAREIQVTLQDKQVMPARLVGRDEATDLAVIKIEGRNLPYVSFENSAAPQVGDWVIAVGNPFGLGGTATAGIVSAYARDIGESYVSYLQLDAAINSGNSGGPSFDTRGRVIGVNTAIFSPNGGGSVGIGFAIPADLAQSVTSQLMKTGHVTRGYIGAGVGDLTPNVARQLGVSASQGAVIAEVSPTGPAARAGLRAGDVVVAADGAPIAGARDLIRKVALVAGGAPLKLEVLRGGQRISATATVAQRTN
jgi:serine protease Do